MSEQHAPEQWQTYTDAADGCCRVATKDEDLGVIYEPANARRIVACVNACAGISTDGLESTGLGGLQHIAEATFEQRMDRNQIEQQRDDLLAAAQQTIEENGHLADGDNCTLAVLKAAIAKVKP